MVCQHQSTINLLEVGDSAKQNYLEQSKKTSKPFLLKALHIANDCDLKYKASKNQRLLVELSLMKLASIDFDGEKKNLESVASLDNSVEFIAPASFYKAVTHSKPLLENSAEDVEEKPSRNEKSLKDSVVQDTIETVTEAAVDSPEEQVLSAPVPAKTPKNIPTENIVVHSETKVQVALPDVITAPSKKEVVVSDKVEPVVPVVENKTRETPKINISLAEKRVSALSISSLKAKKVHEQNRKDDSIDESELPKEAFTEKDMQAHWANFVQKLDESGRKILASNLNADTPKLRNETTIWIELPNGTMKKEIEREQYDLMVYLKDKLNNHFISLQITVNEATAKKFAFTPEEKYQKLQEKNPTIDLLRKEFDLDL